MSVDSGFDFKEEVPKRYEIPAQNEAYIAYSAMGINVSEIPKKVKNPNSSDFERIVENLGKSGRLRKKMISFLLEKGTDGLADPVDNTIYDIKGLNYVTNIFGIKWDVLENVSEVSLHEFGHSWLFQNGSFKLLPHENNSIVIEYKPELVEKDEIESTICVKIVSEGVATYVAKRSNDFIRDTMVKAVEESIPGGVNERERCAQIYSLSDGGKINPDTIEEDMALTKDLIKILESGFISKIKNWEFLNEFRSVITYRLGYNLVSKEVDKKMNEGMTESEALLSFVSQNPPLTLEDMAKRLRVER